MSNLFYLRQLEKSGLIVDTTEEIFPKDIESAYLRFILPTEEYQLIYGSESHIVREVRDKVVIFPKNASRLYLSSRISLENFLNDINNLELKKALCFHLDIFLS